MQSTRAPSNRMVEAKCTEVGTAKRDGHRWEELMREQEIDLEQLEKGTVVIFMAEVQTSAGGRVVERERRKEDIERVCGEH